VVVPAALEIGTPASVALLVCGIAGGVVLAGGVLWLSGGVVPKLPSGRSDRPWSPGEGALPFARLKAPRAVEKGR
jgi:hypothetical protein